MDNMFYASNEKWSGSLKWVWMDTFTMKMVKVIEIGMNGHTANEKRSGLLKLVWMETLSMKKDQGHWNWYKCIHFNNWKALATKRIPMQRLLQQEFSSADHYSTDHLQTLVIFNVNKNIYLKNWHNEKGMPNLCHSEEWKVRHPIFHSEQTVQQWQKWGSQNLKIQTKITD